MAEEPKNIRLKKVATEFNVGVSSIIELLAKKGLPLAEQSLNARLTHEQYEVLSHAFQGERKVKEEADKIELTANSNIVISAEPKEEKPSVQEDAQDLIIKNCRPTSKPIEMVEENAPVKEETPVEIKHEAEPKHEIKETEEKKETENRIETAKTTKSQEETPAKKPEEKPEEKPAPAPKPEPQVISANVPGSKDGSSAFNAEIHIVDKINLADINTKVRPEKKSKEKKRKEREAAKQAAKQQVSKPIAATTTTPATPVAPANKGNNTKEEPVAQKQEKEVEFIETQYKKLEGPKVVTKIDLTQFEKPKSGKDNEKKKRKRIRKEGVKVENVGNEQGGQQKEKKSNKDKNQKNNSANNKEQKNNNAKNNNNNQRQDGKKSKKSKGAEKKVVIDDAEIEKQLHETLARLNSTTKSKTSKHNREKRQKVHQRIEEEQLREMENQKTLQVTEFVTANELATMMNIPVTQIISTCMSVGIFVSINQRLDAETIRLIADEFGFEINFASADVVDAINDIEEADHPEDLVPRNPIVTVMGHVDHGKTSLLDYIRNANVIAGEAGGITQHIGAYEVTTREGKKITFLDTPGHEAFTAMRARGAKVTDIAIIVIAADDKIMPQTIEAINHAQAAGVPIVFAINKIDKPAADPDKIKTELANMNLLVEEWGGKYQSQDISAKKGINVDELLEKVLLQAEIMELKGNPTKRAKGTVLESALDKGRGYIAKLLVEDGTIRQGDPILAGTTFGRVRAMYNERNQLVQSAGPSQPVLLLGLNGACQAGDTFNVMENEKEARDIANKRTQLQREQGIRTQKHITLDEIGRRIAIGDFKELNVIVKGDVDGSVEALSDSLLKLSTEEVQVNVIHKAVGQITENDVLLAESSNAVIVGFQVRPSVQARRMAETEQIDIRLYSIIYDAINELKDAIEGMLSPERQEKIVANLEIRETFKISKVGTIAGCMCLDGKINRNHNIRIIRDGIVVYTGKLASLKRFKDDVKEVVSGQDCGLNIENFNDIKVGDIVEAYDIIEIKRKL